MYFDTAAMKHVCWDDSWLLSSTSVKRFEAYIHLYLNGHNQCYFHWYTVVGSILINFNLVSLAGNTAMQLPYSASMLFLCSSRNVCEWHYQSFSIDNTADLYLSFFCDIILFSSLLLCSWSWHKNWIQSGEPVCMALNIKLYFAIWIRLFHL